MLSFMEFCKKCEQIKSCSKPKEKETHLEEFFRQLREKKINLHACLRLLLPQSDRKRGPYGLKEVAMAKMYIRMLCLTENSVDGQKLLKYKHTAGKTADFADIAFMVLKKWCSGRKTLDVEELNNRLDSIANYHANRQPRDTEKVFSDLLSELSATELKWAIRIILKDLRLGLGHDRILRLFHRDAVDCFDAGSDLATICEKLSDPATSLDDVEIEPMRPFRAMLATMCDNQVFGRDIADGKPYYAETKFDGERFQLHKLGEAFKYYSKKGFDYSNVYGADRQSGLLTPLLADALDADSVILDGEMMGWNKKSRRFGSKGMAYDVKKLKRESLHRPCFCVFDVLYLNGEKLARRSLRERCLILDRILTPVEGVILLSQRVQVENKDQILEELNREVSEAGEGIMLKDPDSFYKPNNRKAGWYKLKYDYFEGLLTELDLLIVGGCYTDRRRRGVVTSFLVAVAQTPAPNDSRPVAFLSCGKVANGLSRTELEELLEQLDQHWITDSLVVDNVVFGREKPDVWIEPKNSCVLQVKASELVRTSAFGTKYTLRFPRIQKVRADKPFSECMTIWEMEEFTKSSKAVEKLDKKRISAEDVAYSKKKRKIRGGGASVLQVVEYEGETRGVILEGLEFCVLNGSEERQKKDTEEFIVRNGGKVVQIEGLNTFCILHSDAHARLPLLIEEKKHNVMKTTSFFEAVSDQTKISEWSPVHFDSMSRQSAVKYSRLFDEFGDSFTSPTCPVLLEKILKKMNLEEDRPCLLPDECDALDDEMEFCNVLAIFRHFTACFPKFGSSQSFAARKAEMNFKFYGGQVCEQLESHVTHIIICSAEANHAEDLRNLLDHCKAKIVSEKWIEHCVSGKCIVPEDAFVVFQ